MATNHQSLHGGAQLLASGWTVTSRIPLQTGVIRHEFQTMSPLQDYNSSDMSNDSSSLATAYGHYLPQSDLLSAHKKTTQKTSQDSNTAPRDAGAAQKIRGTASSMPFQMSSPTREPYVGSLVQQLPVEPTAIRQACTTFFRVPVDAAPLLPDTLAAAGLSMASFASIISTVKAFKERSNKEKLKLYHQKGFFMARSLIDQRKHGHGPLREKILPILLEMNESLATSNINVRVLWVDGAMNFYYL